MDRLMLIDRYLPSFDTTTVEHTVVDADVAATWAALTQLATLASYEARTATTDLDSARHFARYWRLVAPFVGHIMRAALATLAADATARRPAPAEG